MSNIKLKHLLTEQWSPDPAQKQLMQVTGDMVNKSNKQIAKSIAKNIYNSSKWYNDDEVGLIKTIKQIPNNTVYTLMQDELKKLTGGLDLASYLKTFLDRTDLATWDSILKHLKKKLPITQVYPIGKQYFKLANSMTNTKLTGTEFVSPDYVKWYKNKQVQAVNNFSYSPTATITKTVQNSVYSYRHEILDVTGSDSNQWYEVPYLAQGTIYQKIANTGSDASPTPQVTYTLYPMQNSGSGTGTAVDKNVSYIAVLPLVPV